MVPDAGCGLRREKVAPGGLEEFQHRLVFKRWRIGEVDHHLRAGHGLLDTLAGDGVDAAIGRGGEDLVTALAQNRDGLRADQAGAANDDDLHGLPSVVDDRCPPRRICPFIRASRQDESLRRTVQYPPFGGKRPDFGSLIASGSDPSGTSDLEFSALRPDCQRARGQRSLLAAPGQKSTGALVPSSPSVRLLRTYPGTGARTP